MRSHTPKVLHRIAGKEILRWVMDAVQVPKPDAAFIVVGPDGPDAQGPLMDGATLLVQRERLGTGHALKQARSHLQGRVDNIMVVNGDIPLISGRTLQRMMDHHLESEAILTLLTCRVDDPGELGRIVRNSQGRVTRIIEHREAGPQHLEISEICCGAYCFRDDWLWPELEDLEAHESGEYYLTDLVSQASRGGVTVETIEPGDPVEALGVNDRKDLARAASILYQRARDSLMARGVTLQDPPSTFIDATVEIGIDTIILPYTTITGSTKIGESCQIGPQATIADGTIGNRCRIQGSVIEESTLDDGVEVGPFCHIRPGSHLETGVHLGNYVEVKKSRLGRGTRVGHFTYLGDATLGAKVNIGAGTITCNYDGVKKNPTIIGDEAFIGCDSMLVAPLTIGARAVTGAGAVVTHDVPDDTLVVGMPARARKDLTDESYMGED